MALTRNMPLCLTLPFENRLAAPTCASVLCQNASTTSCHDAIQLDLGPLVGRALLLLAHHVVSVHSITT
jgi:hypothetical protein